MAHKVSKRVAPGACHAQTPARLSHQVDDVGDGGPRWRGKAVFEIFVALADDLQIESKHQCAAPCRFAALNHLHHGTAVAHHVELKPEGGGGVLGNVFNRADAHGGQRERNAKLLSRFGRLDFTIGVLHAA